MLVQHKFFPVQVGGVQVQVHEFLLCSRVVHVDAGPAGAGAGAGAQSFPVL